MPVTLSEAQNNAETDLDVAVIDEFRTNPLMDLLTFDDVVNPAGGGATLTYGYRRLVAPATAGFRAINSEYTPSEVTSEKFTVDLVPLGGSFQVDRVLAKVGPAASGAIALNMSQKIKATQATFGDQIINGDTAVDANGFDGLSKALAGSDTEDTAEHDWSAAMTQDLAFAVLDDVDDLLTLMNGNEATALIGHRKAINKIRAAARRTSAYTQTPGPRQTTIERYGQAVLVEAGWKADGTDFVIPVAATDPDSTGPLVAGSTSVYAVRFGLDAFKGVAVAGGSLVNTWMPQFQLPGAVKTGEVELGPVAVALMNSRCAAVLRNVKVQ
jgi:hypothetical protein